MKLQSNALEKFSLFLERNLGLHYPKNREKDLEQKCGLIAKALDFAEPVDCLDWLMQGPLDDRQVDILTTHLTNGETYFFRDEHFYSTLEKEILPDLIKRHQADKSIKIWSAACSTGEEPYSIAILLHRLLGRLEDWDITILATDINRHFLNKALSSRYKKWSFRVIKDEIKERYFQKNDDDSYTLIPQIRQMVQFSYLNLVADPYPEQKMDLICCHNVLIYFSEQQIGKTIHQLSCSLNEGGILTLAPIEIPFVAEKNLVLQRYPEMICHKRGVKEEAPPPPKRKEFKLDVHKPVKKPLPEKKSEKKESLYEECCHLYENKFYGEAADKLSHFLAPFQKEPRELLKYLKEVQLLIRSYANKGEILKGLEWSQAALSADKLNPLTHYLYATVLHASGERMGAIQSLKAALFIDAHFIMAHYLLGVLEREQGDELAYKQHIQVALKLMEDLPSQVTIPGTDEPSEYLKTLIMNSL